MTLTKREQFRMALDKFADMIDKGAKKTPPAMSSYMTYNKDGKLCTDAFGAAMFEFGMVYENCDWRKFKLVLHPNFDQLTLFFFIKHPVHQRPEPFFSLVSELNDEHKWTREAIAQYLRTCELFVNPAYAHKVDDEVKNETKDEVSDV